MTTALESQRHRPAGAGSSQQPRQQLKPPILETLNRTLKRCPPDCSRDTPTCMHIFVTWNSFWLVGAQSRQGGQRRRRHGVCHAVHAGGLAGRRPASTPSRCGAIMSRPPALAIACASGKRTAAPHLLLDMSTATAAGRRGRRGRRSSGGRCLWRHVRWGICLKGPFQKGSLRPRAGCPCSHAGRTHSTGPPSNCHSPRLSLAAP